MKVSDLSSYQLSRQLQHLGLGLRLGPFSVRVKSPFEQVHRGIETLYSEFETADLNEFFDFTIEVTKPSSLRRFIRQQVIFTIDGHRPFKPMPAAHALPVFEWGLNWSIANHAHQYLMIHAAVVEKNNRACILPGAPGSGKSTLCAALVSKGWRLLSDEMTLIDLENMAIVPNPRPISLKNNSIDIIKRYWPAATMGPLTFGTDKGTIAHIKPPAASVVRQSVTSTPHTILFPKYIAGHDTKLEETGKANAMLSLIENSFNFYAIGKNAFITLADTVEQCHCLKLRYSDLDSAIATLERIHQDD